MTEKQFRKEVKTGWPYVKISVRTVSFAGFGCGSAKCLTVDGDKRGDLQHINALAEQAGIIPDKSIRCFPIDGGRTPRKFYECGICGAYHPWEWDGDCREDANRYLSVSDDAVVFSWEERLEADDIPSTLQQAIEDLHDEAL